MLYVNHSNPKVQNVMAAQQLMRVRLRDLFNARYAARTKAERLAASKGFATLDNAMVHLSEEIRSDSACWREA